MVTDAIVAVVEDDGFVVVVVAAAVGAGAFLSVPDAVGENSVKIAGHLLNHSSYPWHYRDPKR